MKLKNVENKNKQEMRKSRKSEKVGNPKKKIGIKKK